jgi:menaquinone-dependent protoporphyrinogen IX oxidase
MKGIVLYKGKYGATAQYASWIAEALYLPIVDIEHGDGGQITPYDYVIIGSSVYVGKMLIRNWLRKNQTQLGDKKILFFVVCGTSDGEKKLQDTIINENVPESLINASEFFFVAGRMVINKLSWLDRLIVKMGALMQKDTVKKEAMLRGFDGVKRENVNPLIKRALQYSNTEVLP